MEVRAQVREMEVRDLAKAESRKCLAASASGKNVVQKLRGKCVTASWSMPGIWEAGSGSLLPPRSVTPGLRQSLPKLRAETRSHSPRLSLDGFSIPASCSTETHWSGRPRPRHHGRFVARPGTAVSPGSPHCRRHLHKVVASRRPAPSHLALNPSLASALTSPFAA